MRFIIALVVVLHVLVLGLGNVKSQAGTEILSCDFEMPMDCGFVVRTAAGGIQWSLNQGKSFDGRIYGPPVDHTTATADGYYASTVVVGTYPFVVVYPVKTDMMTPTILLPMNEGSLVFYFYVWRNTRNDQHGTTLNVYGCQGRQLWGSTVHVAMEGWQRLEIPLQCEEPFEIYFEGIHETIGSSISIDDVTIYSTSLDTGHHSPLPPYQGADVTEASIPESMATRPSGDPLSTLTVTGVVPPTKASIGKNGIDIGPSSVLAVVLFLMAFLLLGISVSVHVFFWRKRWLRRDNQEKPTGIQVQNSAYDCLTLQPGALNGFRGSPEGDSQRSSLRSHKEMPAPNSHSVDVESNGTSTMDSKRSKKRSGKLHRTRSKTMPSKGSQSSFKYYEIVEVDDSTGKNVIRRAPKLASIGRSRAISRSNSMPLKKQLSSGNYEMVDCIGPGGLYHVTDLVSSPLDQEQAVFTFESSVSSCESKSLYNTPSGTVKRQEIPTTSKDHRYSTLSARVSQKLQMKARQTPTMYDTPSTKKPRRKSSEHGPAKSPNYYTLEPGTLIPDVVSTSKLTNSAESSRDSERLECYDQLDFVGTPENLSDDYADTEDN